MSEHNTLARFTGDRSQLHIFILASVCLPLPPLPPLPPPPLPPPPHTHTLSYLPTTETDAGVC